MSSWIRPVSLFYSVSSLVLLACVCRPIPGFVPSVSLSCLGFVRQPLFCVILVYFRLYVSSYQSVSSLFRNTSQCRIINLCRFLFALVFPRQSLPSWFHILSVVILVSYRQHSVILVSSSLCVSSPFRFIFILLVLSLCRIFRQLLFCVILVYSSLCVSSWIRPVSQPWSS